MTQLAIVVEQRLPEDIVEPRDHLGARIDSPGLRRRFVLPRLAIGHALHEFVRGEPLNFLGNHLEAARLEQPVDVPVGRVDGGAFGPEHQP